MPVGAEPARSTAPERTGRAALLVAAGILLSRIFGLIRQRFLGHYLGLGDSADAFNAAFKIPNFLQNLFGEGVLSASFIPVYARLLAEGDEREARRVAGAVAGLLAVTTAIIVVLGVLATPWLIAVIAPGFSGDKRALTITLVRVFFPGAGVLVLSAWCLGVLNSHRRFFISYTAPIFWNLAIIATLIAFGRSRTQSSLAIDAAWGSLAGSVLQLLVQLPTVLKLVGRVRPSLDVAAANVRTVIRNFVPVFVGRGVVQISGYVDVVLASLLPAGAVAGLTTAQTLYVLPVSLFGMSVSAAELPAMSSALGDEREIGAHLRTRLECRAPPHRLPRRAVRRGVSCVRRRPRGGPVPDRAVHARRLGIRLGHPRRLGRRTPRVDTRPVVFVGVLRAARHQARRSASRWSASRSPPGWAPCSRSSSRRCSRSTSSGEPRASPRPPASPGGPSFCCSGGRSIGASVAQACPRPSSPSSGARRSSPRPRRGASEMFVGVAHPILLAVLALIPYGLVYFGLTTAFSIPESRTVLAAVLRRR